MQAMADAHVGFLEMLRRDQNGVDVLPREWVRAEQNLLFAHRKLAVRWNNAAEANVANDEAPLAIEMAEKSFIAAFEADHMKLKLQIRKAKLKSKVMPAPKWKSRLRCFPSVSVAKVAVEDKSVARCQRQNAPEA